MKKPTLLVLLLAAASAVGATLHAVPSVADPEWQNHRVLLMSASSGEDAQLRAQRRLVATWPGAAERDLKLVQIVGDDVQGSSEPAARLRARFELPAEGFVVLLLGKDGHVALRSLRPLVVEVLAATIDAMPMRNAEMAGQHDTARSHPTRAQLAGAWRLVGIETTTRAGTMSDPFFETGSEGLIIYDASGWMSVQISGPHRIAWAVPVSRTSTTRKQNLRLKAAAYDSYYAYIGTWDYDQATAVMTHHVTSSVIPAEKGLDYAQQITVSGNRMTFTGHAGAGDSEFTRTKIWERIDPP